MYTSIVHCFLSRSMTCHWNKLVQINIRKGNCRLILQIHTYSLDDLFRMVILEIERKKNIFKSRVRIDKVKKGESEPYLNNIVSPYVKCVFENDIRISEEKDEKRRRRERDVLWKELFIYTIITKTTSRSQTTANVDIHIENTDSSL